MTNANDPISPAIDERQGSYYEGLTKREYFAAMTMTGLLFRSEYNEWLDAIQASADADYLIEALNK